MVAAAQIAQEQDVAERLQRTALQMSAAASWARRYGVKPVQGHSIFATAKYESVVREWLNAYADAAYGGRIAVAQLAKLRVWGDSETDCAHRMACRENMVLLDLIRGSIKNLRRTGPSIPQDTTIMMVDGSAWAEMSPSLLRPDMLCELEQRAMVAMSWSVPKNTAVLVQRHAMRVVDFDHAFEKDGSAVGLSRTVGVIYCEEMATLALRGDNHQ